MPAWEKDERIFFSPDLDPTGSQKGLHCHSCWDVKLGPPHPEHWGFDIGIRWSHRLTVPASPRKQFRSKTRDGLTCAERIDKSSSVCYSLELYATLSVSRSHYLWQKVLHWRPLGALCSCNPALRTMHRRFVCTSLTHCL